MARMGTVTETHGIYARLTTSRRGICDGCSDKSSCSFDMALGKGKEEEITAVNPIKAKPGDAVEFDLEGHTELTVSIIVWVVPLIGLILGAVTGTMFHGLLSLSENIGTLIGAISGFGLFFFSVFLYERYFVNRSRLLPSIIKVVDASTFCEKS